MRTRTLFIGAALFISASLNAQSGFTFGAKAGLNLTNLIGDNTGTGHTGFHVGAIGNYGFGKNGNASVLGEMLFDTKGWKDDVGKTWNLSYIDIPIMFRYRFYFGMYAEGGLYVGFLAGASSDGKSEVDIAVTDSTSRRVKVIDALNGSDLGFIGGIGYIHPKGFGIGWRYSVGLKNIDKNADPNSPLGVGSVDVNVAMQFSVKYYFNWGK